MAEKKKAKDYEDELKGMIKHRTGADCEPWLYPQLRATAMNMAMLDKVQDELEKEPFLVCFGEGSVGQKKKEAHPLLAHYDKMQRTLIQQFEALGLNFKTTPSKVKEDTKRGVDEDDPMAAYYKGKQ